MLSTPTTIISIWEGTRLDNKSLHVIDWCRKRILQCDEVSLFHFVHLIFQLICIRFCQQLVFIPNLVNGWIKRGGSRKFLCFFIVCLRMVFTERFLYAFFKNYFKGMKSRLLVFILPPPF